MELVYETLPIIGILIGIFIIGVFSVVGSLIMINNVLNKPLKAEMNFMKKDIEYIKDQVDNHIPTEIKKIQEDIVEIKKDIKTITQIVQALIKPQVKK